MDPVSGGSVSSWSSSSKGQFFGSSPFPSKSPPPKMFLMGLVRSMLSESLSGPSASYFESVGDWQLTHFKADPRNQGKVMDRGLWRYTRHPNYFGDFCIWWGLYAICASGGAAWTILSPALMAFLLMRVSGVTLLESNIKDRRPDYAAYQARTNAFFPLATQSLIASRCDLESVSLFSSQKMFSAFPPRSQLPLRFKRISFHRRERESAENEFDKDQQLSEASDHPIDLLKIFPEVYAELERTRRRPARSRGPGALLGRHRAVNEAFLRLGPSRERRKALREPPPLFRRRRRDDAPNFDRRRP